VQQRSRPELIGCWHILTLPLLEGVQDPDQKESKDTFINIFEEVAEFEAAPERRKPVAPEKEGGVVTPGDYTWTWLMVNPSFKGLSAMIKAHHKGLLKDMKLKLIVPLREVFERSVSSHGPLLIPHSQQPLPAQIDQVHALGHLLSIPSPFVQWHPFCGAQVSPMCIPSPITCDQVTVLQQAKHNLHQRNPHCEAYDWISQAHRCVARVKLLGVMGDRELQTGHCTRAVQQLHVCWWL